jgi:hypothetical protein
MRSRLNAQTPGQGEEPAASAPVEQAIEQPVQVEVVDGHDVAQPQQAEPVAETQPVVTPEGPPNLN